MIKRELPKGLSNRQNNELQGFFSWNGFFYGYRRLKRKCKYYKSKTVRFDETFGGVFEIDEYEYIKYLGRYTSVFVVGR